MSRFVTAIFIFLLAFSFNGICNEYEVTIGRNVSAIIFGKYKPIQNDALIRYVNLVGQSVVSTSGRRDISFHFSVLDSDTIQAFAAPGGYIFITKGLLDIIKTEAELAGVLAHEIAHVNLKHVFSKLYEPEQKKPSLLARLFNSKNTSLRVAFNEVSQQAVGILFHQGLSENDEYESDIAAIFYLQNTGYNCQAYLDIISRLPQKDVSHSKTHPTKQKRIQSIEDIFKNLNFSYGNSLAKRFNSHVTP